MIGSSVIANFQRTKKASSGKSCRRFRRPSPDVVAQRRSILTGRLSASHQKGRPVKKTLDKDRKSSAQNPVHPSASRIRYLPLRSRTDPSSTVASKASRGGEAVTGYSGCFVGRGMLLHGVDDGMRRGLDVGLRHRRLRAQQSRLRAAPRRRRRPAPQSRLRAAPRRQHRAAP